MSDPVLAARSRLALAVKAVKKVDHPDMSAVWAARKALLDAKVERLHDDFETLVASAADNADEVARQILRDEMREALGDD